MADIAELGFKIDSSQATAATKNLDDMTAAASRAESGSEKMAAKAQAAAEGVSKVSASTSVASGGLDNLTGSAGVAAQAMGALGTASESATRILAMTTRELDASAASARAEAAEWVAASKAKAVAAAEAAAAQKAAAAAQREASVAAAESAAGARAFALASQAEVKTLDDVIAKRGAYKAALDSGLLSQEKYFLATHQLGEEEKLIQQALLKTGQEAEKIALNFGSAYQKTEAFRVAGDALTGQWVRAERSGFVLANSTGLMAAAFSGAGLAIAAIAAPIAIAIAAFVHADNELQGFNKALIATGQDSIENGKQVQEAATRIGESTGHFSLAEEALTKLISTGKFIGPELETAARGVVAFADLTGESIDKSVGTFQRLMDEPLKASLKLDEQLHYLSVSEVEQIANFEAMGDKANAGAIATKAFTAAMVERDAEVRSKLGGWRKAWDEISTSIGTAFDKLGQYIQRQANASTGGSFTQQLLNYTPLGSTLGVGSAVSDTIAKDRQFANVESQSTPLQLGELAGAYGALAAGANGATASIARANEESRKAADVAKPLVAAAIEEAKKLQDLADTRNKTQVAKVDETENKALEALASAVGKDTAAYNEQADTLKVYYGLQRQAALAEDEHTASLKHHSAAALDATSAMDKLRNIIGAAVGALDPAAKITEQYEKNVRAVNAAVAEAVKRHGDLNAITVLQKTALASLNAEKDKELADLAKRRDVSAAVNAAVDLETKKIVESHAQKEAERIVTTALNEAKKAGLDITTVDTQALKDNATARIAAADAIEAQRKSLDSLLKSQADRLDKLNTELQTGDKMSAMQKAENDLIKDHIDLNSKDAEVQAKINALRQGAMDEQRVASLISLNKDLAGTFTSIAQSIQGGTSIGKAFGDVLHNSLGVILKDFKALSDSTGGFKNGLSSLVDSFKTPEGQKTLASLGQLTGAIVSSQGSRAATTIGGAISAASTAAAFTANPYAIAIAAVVGAVQGYLSNKGDPKIYAGSGAGSTGRHGSSYATPFGNVMTDTDGLPDDAYQGYALAIKGFDQQIARALDPSQMTAVRAALANWKTTGSDINAVLGKRFDTILGTFDKTVQDFVNSMGSDLQTRAQALADALDIKRQIDSGVGNIGTTVAESLKLVNQFVTAGESAAQTWQRIVVDVTNLTTAMNLMGNQSELSKVALAQLAEGIATAVGGTENASKLWDTYFTKFYSDSERAATAAKLAKEQSDKLLTGLGVDTSISMADFRTAFEKGMPTMTSAQIAAWLQAGAALSAATDAQAAYDKAIGATTTAVVGLTQAQKDAQYQAIKDYASLVADTQNNVNELQHPSSDFQKALQAIAKGMADTQQKMQDAAKAAGLAAAREQDLAVARQYAALQEEVLQKQLIADSAPLVDALFGTATNAQSAASSLTSLATGLQDVQNASENFRNSMLLDPNLSPLNVQQQYDEALKQLGQDGSSQTAQTALTLARKLMASGDDYKKAFDLITGMVRGTTAVDSGGAGGSAQTATAGLTDSQRIEDAQKLAQNLADLAGSKNESFIDAAKELKFSLTDLGNVLGLQGDDLTNYLKSLQAKSYDLDDMATMLDKTVTQPIVDAIYKALNLLSQTIVHGGVPGSVQSMPAANDDPSAGGLGWNPGLNRIVRRGVSDITVPSSSAPPPAAPGPPGSREPIGPQHIEALGNKVVAAVLSSAKTTASGAESTERATLAVADGVGELVNIARAPVSAGRSVRTRNVA